MKIQIELPFEHYSSFLDRFVNTEVPEYYVLKNGVILRRQMLGEERRIIVILCDVSQAERLLLLAQALDFPAVEGVIRKALGSNGKINS